MRVVELKTRFRSEMIDVTGRIEAAPDHPGPRRMADVWRDLERPPGMGGSSFEHS